MDEHPGDLATTERQYEEAEKRLVVKNQIKLDRYGLPDDEDLRTMTRCFNGHAVAARQLLQENGRLHAELTSTGHRADLAAGHLAQAAAARAAIATKAVAELRRLLPAAVSQAKKGRPALLRMILRASR